ncbi:hypothetical protein PHYPSEUDO_011181 [Phytophthora pseudosyringae]|uniref:Uncharacterized protein n=1 Tax=Phytophthora pseudosyringae TaxID=221518 RepID=A0A8T1V9H9_9STRA|nr:hypothetical protein PHYPSEUDO_011181 [Phytophthora pseudosyringae]
MLSIRRSLRGAIAPGRHVSQLRGAARMLPHTSGLVSSSECFSSSRSSRSFSQISTQETSETAKKTQKPKFYRSRGAKTSAQEAAKRSENLTRLQANPGDADVALEVFAAIQSANGSGLSKDVGAMLITTFVDKKKLDRALQVLELSSKQKVYLLGPPHENLMTACYKVKEFDTVLKRTGRQSELEPKILEQMLKDAKPHAARAFQVVLSAAVNSKQHELVLTLMEISKAFDVVLTSEHYHFVLKSYTAVGDMQAALGTRDTLQQNGFDLTEDGMHWLVHCASKADQWDLVERLLISPSPNADKDEGVVAKVSTFNAAIAAYGNKKRWNKVVDVYDIMPENLRSELKGWHLGSVVMGHGKMESKELKARALEIFNDHKEKANSFAYGGAMTALVGTEQFDAALALAEDMKAKEIVWGKSSYQAVALALIRCGSTEEAVQLLEQSVLRMGNDPEGYMDIIQFYTDRHPHHNAKEV